MVIVLTAPQGCLEGFVGLMSQLSPVIEEKAAVLLNIFETRNRTILGIINLIFKFACFECLLAILPFLERSQVSFRLGHLTE
jgi:hypothetical protein